MIFFTNNELHKGFGLAAGPIPPKEEEFHAKIEEIRKEREAHNLMVETAASGTAAGIIATSSSSSGHKAVTHMDTRPTSPGQRNAGPPSQVHRFQAAVQASSWSKAVSRPVNTKPSGPSPGLNLRPQVQAATTNVQAWSKAVSRPVGNANAGPQAGQLQAGTVQAPGNNAMTPGPGTTPNTHHDDPNAPASFSDPIFDPKPKIIHDGFGHNLNEPDPVHAKNRRIIHDGFRHNLKEPDDGPDPVHAKNQRIIHDGFRHNLKETDDGPDPVHAKNQRIIHDGFRHNLREEDAKKEDHDQKKK